MKTAVPSRDDGLPFHARDGREGGTLAQTPFQLGQGLLQSLRHDLHRSVGAIAGEAGHAQPLRLPQHEVAIADALDTAEDDVAMREHDPPSGCGAYHAAGHARVGPGDRRRGQFRAGRVSLPGAVQAEPGRPAGYSTLRIFRPSLRAFVSSTEISSSSCSCFSIQVVFVMRPMKSG